jgi:hypothetical protein
MARSYRIAGILGTSFCGSTAFSAALDCLPGVAAGGELHWAVDDGRGPVYCGRCGPSCPVFDKDFFAAATAENAYDLAAARLGCDVLVSSDKWPSIYDRFVGALDLAIVLWKPPEAAVGSYMWHDGQQTWQGAAKLWCDSYARVMRWAADVPTVGVNLATFMSDPPAGLGRLCEAAGGLLPYAPLKALQDIEYHALGGNLAAHQRGLGWLPVVTRKLPPDAAVRDEPGVGDVLAELAALPGLP